MVDFGILKTKIDSISKFGSFNPYISKIQIESKEKTSNYVLNNLIHNHFYMYVSSSSMCRIILCISVNRCTWNWSPQIQDVCSHKHVLLLLKFDMMHTFVIPLFHKFELQS